MRVAKWFNNAVNDIRTISYIVHGHVKSRQSDTYSVYIPVGWLAQDYCRET